MERTDTVTLKELSTLNLHVMNALKCITPCAMSSWHCGQTDPFELTKRNLLHTGCLQCGKSTIICMHAFLYRRKMANSTYGAQWREY